MKQEELKEEKQTIEEKEKEAPITFGKSLLKIKEIEKSFKFREFKESYEPEVPFKSQKQKRENKEIFKTPQCNSNYVPLDNNFFFNPKYVLGKGGYGNVYYGSDSMRTKDYAIKFQNNISALSITIENRILKKLKDEVGFPQVYCVGTFKDKKYLIEELLGPTLDKLFKFCGKKFCPLTVIKISQQMLQRIQTIHEKGIIHRDIKTNNFAFGKFHTVCWKKGSGSNLNSEKLRKFKDFSYFENDLIYLIDFGLSLEENSQQQANETTFIGSLKYSALSSHYRIPHTKEDDIESFFYVLVYLLNGYLPWDKENLPETADRYKETERLKSEFPKSEFFKKLPRELHEFYRVLKNKPHNEPINYTYLNQILTIFNHKLTKTDFSSENKYLWDWEIKIIKDKTKNGLNKISVLFKGYPIINEIYIDSIKEKNIRLNNWMFSLSKIDSYEEK